MLSAGDDDNTTKTVISIVVPTVALLILLPIFVFIFIRKRKQEKPKENYESKYCICILGKLQNCPSILTLNYNIDDNILIFKNQCFKFVRNYPTGPVMVNISQLYAYHVVV